MQSGTAQPQRKHTMNTITYNPLNNEISFTRDNQRAKSNTDYVYVHGLDGFNRESVLNTLKKFGVLVEIIRFEKLDKLANTGHHPNPNYDSTKINGQIVCINSLDYVLTIAIELFKELTGNSCKLKKKSRNNPKTIEEIRTETRAWMMGKGIVPSNTEVEINEDYEF